MEENISTAPCADTRLFLRVVLEKYPLKETCLNLFSNGRDGRCIRDSTLHNACGYENVSASLFISRVFAATLIFRQKLQDKSQQKLAQCDNTFIKLHVPGRRNKGNKATHTKWQIATC